jgi:hypothetical protein
MREREFHRSLNRWREEDEAVLVNMERDDSDEEGDPLSSERSQTEFHEYSV